MMSMLLLSIMPVMAETSSPIAGETITTDLTTEDVEPHSSIGGIISQIGELFERFVSFGEIRIWKNQINTLATDYELYAFPAGGPNPNFEAIEILGVFETSEDVLVREVQGIWETNLVSFNSAPDYAAPANIGDTMIFDSQDTAAVIASEWIIDTYQRNGLLNEEAYVFNFENQCSGIGQDPICGWLANAEEFFGGTLETESTWRWAETPFGYVMAFKPLDGDYLFAVDKNADGMFEFVGSEINGYMVDSIDTQSLMLLDTSVGTVDLYAVI